ncbi:uncharacterized protein LOC131166450 isoform X2 [Malania oleifera]|uniref:uncharacterized protein LOC131166450 isoform X2 n=1 Tax=Malania oleifera TaxID=397392 RepID=UPI0025AE340F|nr:uncharacterized protein LOC131166450 isoform X2 [Malania oleifera]
MSPALDKEPGELRQCPVAWALNLPFQASASDTLIVSAGHVGDSFGQSCASSSHKLEGGVDDVEIIDMFSLPSCPSPAGLIHLDGYQPMPYPQNCHYQESAAAAMPRQEKVREMETSTIFSNEEPGMLQHSPAAWTLNLPFQASAGDGANGGHVSDSFGQSRATSHKFEEGDDNFKIINKPPLAYRPYPQNCYYQESAAVAMPWGEEEKPGKLWSSLVVCAMNLPFQASAGDSVNVGHSATGKRKWLASTPLAKNTSLASIPSKLRSCALGLGDAMSIELTTSELSKVKADDNNKRRRMLSNCEPAKGRKRRNEEPMKELVIKDLAMQVAELKAEKDSWSKHRKNEGEKYQQVAELKAEKESLSKSLTGDGEKYQITTAEIEEMRANSAAMGANVRKLADMVQSLKGFNPAPCPVSDVPSTGVPFVNGQSDVPIDASVPTQLGTNCSDHQLVPDTTYAPCVQRPSNMFHCNTPAVPAADSEKIDAKGNKKGQTSISSAPD